jgi:hypothetical protein
MNRRNIAFACLGAGVWLAGCGGGTLGGGVSTGGGGNIMITGPGAASGQGGAGNSGLGGDGVPIGGISGAAGRPGRGGAGGVSGGFSGSMGPGSGGSGFVTCDVPPPVCGTLCGNGQRDACLRALSLGCPPQAWAEECDGTDFGDSCAARGYASGKLVCRSDCTIDASGCSDCASVGVPIIRCGAAPIPVTDLTGFALGATDTEVGLATVSNSNTGGMTLQFGRLTPGLDLAAGWDVVEETSPPGPQGPIRIYAIAVAPLPSDWIVAACGDPQVFFHTFDASGREFARTVVDIVSDPFDACLSGSLTLAPRPGAGPLLLWRSGSDVMASLIADNGLSASMPTAIVGPANYYSDVVSAVWVRDTFYAAATLQRSAGDYRGLIRLVRLPPGGTQTSSDILTDENVYSAPALASGAGDLTVVYNGVPPGGVDGQDYAVLWRRLGPSGEALSYPAVVGVSPYLYGSSRSVAFTADTLVAINGSYINGLITLVHLASDGQTVAPVYNIARSPYYYLGSFAMVRRGSDVVVGWLREGLSLARVTP